MKDQDMDNESCFDNGCNGCDECIDAMNTTPTEAPSTVREDFTLADLKALSDYPQMWSQDGVRFYKGDGANPLCRRAAEEIYRLRAALAAPTVPAAEAPRPSEPADPAAPCCPYCGRENFQRRAYCLDCGARCGETKRLAEPSERARFEEWSRDVRKLDLRRHPDKTDAYIDGETRSAWFAWSAALATPPTEPSSDTPPAMRDIALHALQRAQQFIRNGVALGFIRMPDADTPDTAHETPKIIDRAIDALLASPPPEAQAPSEPVLWPEPMVDRNDPAPRGWTSIHHSGEVQGWNECLKACKRAALKGEAP